MSVVNVLVSSRLCKFCCDLKNDLVKALAVYKRDDNMSVINMS